MLKWRHFKTCAFSLSNKFVFRGPDLKHIPKHAKFLKFLLIISGSSKKKKNLKNCEIHQRNIINNKKRRILEIYYFKTLYRLSSRIPRWYLQIQFGCCNEQWKFEDTMSQFPERYRLQRYVWHWEIHQRKRFLFIHLYKWYVFFHFAFFYFCWY